MTFRARLIVVGLTVLGLAIAVAILLLPPRPQALAIYALAMLGFSLGSIRCGFVSLLTFRDGRPFLGVLLALLALLLLLLFFATLHELLAFASAGRKVA